MSDFLKKIFGNQAVDDLPFPEIPAHTHDGQNSPMLAPQSIDSLQIKTGAVGELALADDSVSSDKIIDSAVLTQHLNTLAVTEQKLAAAAVATDKIKNGAVNASKLIQTEAVITISAQIADAIIASAHIGTGVILNAHLGNAVITTAKIQDGAITNAKIGNAEITSVKIGAAEVKNANIENLAVTTVKIQDLAVEWAKIGSLAVGNSKIMDLAVSTGKIQDLAVEWAKIGSLAVGNSKIMDLAVSTAKIQDLAVGTSQIASAAITNAKIANLAVTDAKINDLSADKITTGLMIADRIWGGAGYFDQVNILICGAEALNVAGNIYKTGTVNFVINHPLKPGHRLIYTAIESAEVLVAIRGIANLDKGKKRIELPDHFQAVSDTRSVTAFVTPRQTCNSLYIEESANDHITVREQDGLSDAEFSYLVLAVRNGYFGFDFEPEGELLIEEEHKDKEEFKAKVQEYKRLKREGHEVIFKNKQPVIKVEKNNQ